jgi:hypothetical protein
MTQEHFEKVAKCYEGRAVLKMDWYGIRIYANDGEYLVGVNTSGLSMKSLKWYVDTALSGKEARDRIKNSNK